MKTAKEQLQQAFENNGYSLDYFYKWCSTYDTYIPFILQAINNSRVEVVEEIAELAKSLYEKTTYTPTTTKVEILKLIEKIK